MRVAIFVSAVACLAAWLFSAARARSVAGASQSALQGEVAPIEADLEEDLAPIPTELLAEVLALAKSARSHIETSLGLSASPESYALLDDDVADLLRSS